MTTFLTITTSDKLVGDTPPSLSEKMLVQPRQTMVSDVQTQTSSMNSQTPSPSASSTLSTLSKATATSTTTTAPILRTIDGVVYFRTSMPALDVIGTPVTTLRQGDPVRPIAVWNATQVSQKHHSFSSCFSVISCSFFIYFGLGVLRVARQRGTGEIDGKSESSYVWERASTNFLESHTWRQRKY